MRFFWYSMLLFGISSGDFQNNDRSADVALAPDNLPVIRILSYLKTNSLQYLLTYFQNKLAFSR